MEPRGRQRRALRCDRRDTGKGTDDVGQANRTDDGQAFTEPPRLPFVPDYAFPANIL